MPKDFESSISLAYWRNVLSILKKNKRGLQSRFTWRERIHEAKRLPLEYITILEKNIVAIKPDTEVSPIWRYLLILQKSNFFQIKKLSSGMKFSVPFQNTCEMDRVFMSIKCGLTYLFRK